MATRVYRPAGFGTPAALRRPPVLRIGLIGPGNVGGALLDALLANAKRLHRNNGVTLEVSAVCNTRRMWLGREGERPPPLRAFADPSGLHRFASFLRGRGEHALLVDCTASGTVAAHYGSWLGLGIHVVTANKLAPSRPWPEWQRTRAAAASAGAHLRYEATVGAGLPVVQTLRDLLDTGDELLAVEGVLSGTHAWLCNRYDGRRPFSALVRKAHAAGYTEPDPRLDLGGTDVARKLVILAREAGRGLSLEEVAIEGLVPRELAACGLKDFLSRLEMLDAPMAAHHARARARGRVLRFVGRLERSGHARVGLEELHPNHPFACAQGRDNVIRFTTRRYRGTPLIVQGPGAGADLTAAGVFTDVLRVAWALGTRP